MGKQLIGVNVVQAEYGIGRDLSRKLCSRLPHLYIGRKRLVVLRHDLEHLLHKAASERRDLWDLANLDEDEVRRWLTEEAEL